MEETDRHEPDKLHALLAAGFSASDPDTRRAYLVEWKHTLEERQRQVRERELDAQLAAAEFDRQKAVRGFLADGVAPEVVARNFGMSLADVLKLATE
ncbi:MAG: hypothetical protein LBR38_08625 [Synergistaceae bacterium]|jgi:hypothetical protein|nr:hypothetical protein [Synergistaceae bacterium]